MNTLIIKCPKCGQEYLPAEIYYPNEFLGKPKLISKNNTKIEDFQGNNMNLIETYICDNCKSQFQVEATVSFKTSLLADTSGVYTTKLRKHDIFFNEE